MSDESNKKNAHDNLVHAGEFTKIENTAIVYVLRGWFAGFLAYPAHWKRATMLGRTRRCSSIS